MCESIIQNTATSNKRISSLFRSISPAEEAAVEMGGAMKVMCPWKAIFLKSGIFWDVELTCLQSTKLHFIFQAAKSAFRGRWGRNQSLTKQKTNSFCSYFISKMPLLCAQLILYLGRSTETRTRGFRPDRKMKRKCEFCAKTLTSFSKDTVFCAPLLSAVAFFAFLGGFD